MMTRSKTSVAAVLLAISAVIGAIGVAASLDRRAEAPPTADPDNATVAATVGSTSDQPFAAGACCTNREEEGDCRECTELLAEASAADEEQLAQGPPFGRGPGRGRGPGGGRGRDENFAADHEVFFFLLEHGDKITRTVKNLPDGIETVTESKDPEVAGKIQEHVAAMYDRVENIKPIHMRDPLFRELFANAKKIKMEMDTTDHGIRVKETSDDPYVAKLLQEHAKVVSLFIKNGFDELHRDHALPERSGSDSSAGHSHQHTASHSALKPAVIEGHGAVVRMPEALDQPRHGSKICVDVTAGGPRDEINPAVEKLARFVNIYSSAGHEPAAVQMTVILHGEATLVALNDDAYASRFGTEGNPNLPLFHKLHAAGVELLVCGQALSKKEAKPEEVADVVGVAVSGLTVNVNRQQDGYSFIPLH